MEHTITNFKRASLFLLLFYAVFSSQDIHAQAVTEVVTDYQGYWKSGPGAALNPIKPMNSHDLLSFTYQGTRYSTGVNDALLNTRGDAFSPQKFIALPMENMSGIPTLETYIGVGQLYDGVNNGASSTPPLNNLAYYLTDGVQGLNIGTCATNIPQGYVSFQVSEVNPASIGDGVPDILITQVAQPSGATDIYSFKDINGNTVGSSVNIVLNGLAPVGNWLADFWRVNANPMFVPPGYINTERPIRLWAADFSDFGITAGNYQSIDHFVINLKGTTDIAFVAYNYATAVITPLPAGIAVLKEGTFVDVNGDCRASIGDRVDYTFKVTNTGQAPLTNITVTDPMVTVSGGPISLAPSAANATNFTATYFITAADIAAGAVYNQARVSGRDPENAIVSQLSVDPTPIGSSSPYFHADCPNCTVTVLLQSATITSPITPLNIDGCGTAAITTLPYSEVPAPVTPAQFIALGGTISNLSLQLSITYQDSKSGTCPVVVTRRFTVISGGTSCPPQNFTQIININDTTKPTADVLADFTLTGCNGTFPAPDVTLVTGEADNCGAVPTVTFVSDSAPTVTGCTETVIRTYKVTDACGNFIEVKQNLIRTADTQAPTASNPADVTLTNEALIPAPDVTVVTDEADNCSTPTVTFVSDSAPVLSGCTETVTRTYKVTDACQNSIEVTQRFIKNIAAAAPVVGQITQPTCTVSTGSVVLTGLPATGEYTIQPGNITASGASFTVTGLTEGTYVFTYSTTSGCASTVSESVIINAVPAVPTAPIVGAITQPSCNVAGGSVVLSGLPSGNWTISNAGETIATGTGSSTTLTDLAPGTYNFTVTVNGDCTSVASAPVTINVSSNPSTPVVVSVTQPTCEVATGTVVISGLPTGNWTIAEIGLTGNGSAPVTVVLPAGTYNLIVTNSNGCNSLPLETPLVINAQAVLPTAPIVGTVTQPTCTVATGSIELTGLPTGNWTLTSSIGAITGSGTTYVVSGLSPNDYTFTVTVGTCTSAASASVTINAAPVLPTAPIVGTVTQPTCTVATGSIELTGLPTGNWTLTSSIGTITGSGTTYVVSGLSPNDYTFTVTAGSCTSSVSASVRIDTVPVVPTAPIVGTVTQPTCANAAGSIELTGLPAGSWTLITASGNITGSGTTYVVGNLAAGTYSYTVMGLEGCDSTVSASVTINAAPGAPSAPVLGTVTQPTCLIATGSVILSGLPTGNWTLVYEGSSVAGTGTEYTLTDLAPGAYNIKVVNAAGCESPSVPVTFNAAGETVNLTARAECNNDDTVGRLINLALLLPTGTPTNGVWTDVSGFFRINGSVINPYEVTVGFYTVNYVVTTADCTQTFAFTVEVDDDCVTEPEAACPILYINAFSPNGDSLNDTFVIKGLDDITCYPTNSVEIYNRWGVLVFETKQYDNNSRVFRGISEGRATVSNSEPLPTGTYFYIVKWVNKDGVRGGHEGYLYLTK